MDTNAESLEMGLDVLSYDDTIPYEELPAPPTRPGRAQLADRIGNNKVYLLPDTAGTRLGKVRW